MVAPQNSSLQYGRDQTEHLRATSFIHMTDSPNERKEMRRNVLLPDSDVQCGLCLCSGVIDEAKITVL